MLVVTPAPYQTESLVGYVIRLAEVNGYDSPGTILCYAGYGSANAIGANCDLRSLSKALGRNVNAFSTIAYGNVRGGKSTNVRIRGHLASSWRVARILSPKETSICPLCVAEQGFINSFWDLTLATACPDHGCKALRVCPGCTKNVTWLRPGLLQCRCGAPLSDVSTGGVEMPVLELLGLLKAKFEKRSLKDCQNSSQFPVRELDRMSFVQLASVLFLLGQHLKRLSHGEALAQPDAVVLGAARALSDWPNGFRHSLVELDGRGTEAGGQLDHLRNQYGALYRAISGERGIASSAFFLRREFDAFLEHEKCHDVLKAKRLNPKLKCDLRKSMTMDWICSRYDFSRKRLEGWCKAKRKNNNSISPRDLYRFIVEAEITNHLKIAKISAITERQAAAMAAVPLSVLKGLRELGYLGTPDADGPRRGYRVSDIETLTEKLQEIGKRVSQHSIRAGRHVSLARLLETTTFWSRLGKSEFLVDVLQRRIESYGRTGDTLQQLYFDRAKVQEYIDERKRAESKHGVTRSEAGIMLGCSTYCVNELVKLGHLATTPGPYYRNISSESVRSFGALYVALNDLAKRTGSSSRALGRKATAHGLKLVLIKCRRGVTTPFICRSEVTLLQESVEQQQSSAAQRLKQRRNRISTSGKLSQYFDSMHQAGTPLQRSGRTLNLRTIAKAAGICRNLFYKNQEMREILAAAEREDARKHGVDSRPDLEVLKSYLDELQRSKESIPIGRKGQPNKLEVARAAGVDRNIFYQSEAANRLLSTY